MGCVWFMYVYRKIELGYWWKHDDVKKKFLTEKCSLMLRALEYLFERYIFCAVLGLPELPRCSERPCVAFSLFRRLQSKAKLFQNQNVSFQVIIYCDLHGHSRKPNVFMYGCTADPKMASMSDFVEERLFPWMMSQKVSTDVCINRSITRTCDDCCCNSSPLYF